jgi:hypothetical protein
MEDQGWMYLKNWNCKKYLDNLKLFIKVAEADKLDKSKSAICCPCVDCKNTSGITQWMFMLILSSVGS